jgi:hypothetical protein
LWHAANDAISNSSGLQQEASPLKDGSDEPAIEGFVPAEITCERSYARYPDVPVPVLPVHSIVTANAWDL